MILYFARVFTAFQRLRENFATAHFPFLAVLFLVPLFLRFCEGGLWEGGLPDAIPPPDAFRTSFELRIRLFRIFC